MSTTKKTAQKTHRVTFSLADSPLTVRDVKDRVRATFQMCGKVEGLNVDVVDATKKKR